MIQWQISHALATRAENVSGDWHDLRECVNLASTRWINAIIGQTWRGENPFKARKAKQGPWLIHLANLRVMYECQGTLVRRGRGECVLAQWVGCMCIFFLFFCFWEGFLMWRCSLVAEQPPWDLVPSLVSSSPSCRLSGQNKWSLDMEMTKRCTECAEWEGSGIALQMRWGNVAVVHWAAEWVPACFAMPRAQSGPVVFPTPCKLNDCFFLYAAVVAPLWPFMAIKCPERADL